MYALVGSTGGAALIGGSGKRSQPEPPLATPDAPSAPHDEQRRRRRTTRITRIPSLCRTTQTIVWMIFFLSPQVVWIRSSCNIVTFFFFYN